MGDPHASNLLQFVGVGTDMQTWFREIYVTERFSIECREVIGFASPHDWLKNSRHFFIQSEVQNQS